MDRGFSSSRGHIELNAAARAAAVTELDIPYI